jgi:predicted transcriptional regulator of viral defense system
MIEYSQLRYWIDELPKRGKTTFSLKDAEQQFKEKPPASVRRALARLVSAGKIHSVWKGFYAISLPEYGLDGIAPPMDYIDQLMNYLGSAYYVALLTAASYNGATHNAVQVFQIVSDNVLHSKIKNGVSIEPVYKKMIPDKYIAEINSRTASVKVSSPELTAVDLIIYMKRAGGVNQVASVLSELAESVKFSRVDPDFFTGVSAAVVQRLGYLLDETLEEKMLADSLYEKSMEAGIKFSPTRLVADKHNSVSAYERNTKWNIIMNYEVESDL